MKRICHETCARLTVLICSSLQLISTLHYYLKSVATLQKIYYCCFNGSFVSRDLIVVSNINQPCSINFIIVLLQEYMSVLWLLCNHVEAKITELS